MKQTRVYSRPKVTEDFDIYVTGEITSPKDYIEDFQALEEAVAGSVCNIFLNTEGGQVRTAAQYLAKMGKTNATVIAHLEGLCHSAGTYIFLSADSWEVQPNSMMLIHNYSGGAYGKGNESIEQAQATRAWVYGLMDTVYAGFLTPEEIESVKSNRDIWLTSEQIGVRLEKLIEYREGLVAEQEQILQTKLENQIKEYSKNVESNINGVSERPAEL